MTNNTILPNVGDDSTPLDSPLDLVVESYGSPGDSMRLIRTESSVQESPSAETECLGQGRCAGQPNPCDLCQKDKKEVSTQG